MRIFVSFSDPVPCDRVCRLNTCAYQSTTDLLQEIATLCRVSRKWLIAKLKHQIINLRICEEWQLEAYPFKNGSWVLVEILPEGLAALSPISSNRMGELAQIQEEGELDFGEQLSSNNNTSSFQKSVSDWNKYFQDALELFLDAVRKGSLEEAAFILKSEPQCDNQQFLDSIMRKKTHFLTNELGNCGRSALHWAIQQKNLDMVEFLLIKSANPNSISLDNYTPLQLAIVLKTNSIFQTLISHPKIDINLISDKGTALHVAVKEKQAAYAKKLIQSGADLQLKNAKGETVQDIANSIKFNISFQLRTPGKVPIPRILRGKILKVSSFTFRLKERFMLVNPFTNQLIVYKDKQLEDSMNISKITSAYIVGQKGWTMKKEFSYFQIQDCFKNKLTFAVKHIQIRTQWIEQLNLCIKFLAQPKIKVQIQEQLIEVIDDEANQIKVHKRKVNNSKKITNSGQKSPSSDKNIGSERRISLFDIKSSHEREEIEHDEEQIKQSVILSERNSSIQQFHTHPILSKEEESNDLTASHVANSQVDCDLRKSDILGSIIDDKIPMKFVPPVVSHNPPDIRNSSIRQSIYDDSYAAISFGDFQILRLLGNGSFGKVFLSRHKKSQHLYALKVLNKKKLSVKKQLKYAVGEANILKKIDHPFVIQLHYSFQTPSNLYMALDYCPHKDLAQLLYDEDRVSEQVCRFYIAQIILAIEYIHKMKIIYRDMKPQNILIGPDGYIRLADFNLSKENDFSMSFCGSPAYLSPEMLQKKGVGPEADIYGIGCVLYEMMIGEPPFFHEDMDVLYQNIKSGKLKFPSDLSKKAKNLISCLLQRNVHKRIGVKSFSQIKKHEFFKDMNWKKLERKQVQIPAQLKHRFDDDANIELEVIKEQGFTDTDYNNRQNMMNRVKNFTFVRQDQKF